MKIIDLLNKIANGEEVPKRIKYCGAIYEKYDYNNKYYDIDINGKEKDILSEHLASESFYNDEVEILEEEKKIPEKLPYYSMKKIQKAKNKDERREERISLLEKRVEDLHIKMNDLLDYLKSKEE